MDVNVLARGIGVLMVSVCLALGSAHAQNVVHHNTLGIVPAGENKYDLVFLLNLPQVFHKTLSPNADFYVFLEKYSNLRDLSLLLEIEKVKKVLNKIPIMSLDSGADLYAKEWEFPEVFDIRAAFRMTEALKGLPVNLGLHVDPLPVKARVEFSKELRAGRFKIEPPQPLLPLLIRYKNDAGWSTEQIPYLIMDF